MNSLHIARIVAKLAERNRKQEMRRKQIRQLSRNVFAHFLVAFDRIQLLLRKSSFRNDRAQEACQLQRQQAEFFFDNRNRFPELLFIDRKFSGKGSRFNRGIDNVLL